MSITNAPIPTLDVFVDKFRHLTPEEQDELLGKLTAEKTPTKPSAPGKKLEDLFGAWSDDDRTAEEVIRDIYESRTMGRDIEL